MEGTSLYPSLGLTTLEGHGPPGAGLEEGYKDDLKMKNVSFEDRLTELGLLSLEKRKLWRDIRAASQ